LKGGREKLEQVSGKKKQREKTIITVVLGGGIMMKDEKKRNKKKKKRRETKTEEKANRRKKRKRGINGDVLNTIINRAKSHKRKIRHKEVHRVQNTRSTAIIECLEV